MSSVEILTNKEYKYGFVTDIESDMIPRGLSEDTIRLIVEKKKEPDWMLEFRLKAYRHWLTMTEPRHWPNITFPQYFQSSDRRQRNKRSQEIFPYQMRRFCYNTRHVPPESARAFSLLPFGRFGGCRNRFSFEFDLEVFQRAKRGIGPHLGVAVAIF